MLDQEELKYIASTYQTPCFIFDEEALIERVKEIRKMSGSACGSFRSVFSW